MKRMLAISLLIMMMVSLSVPAFALGIIDEKPKTDSEQIFEIQNNPELTSAQKQLMISKITSHGKKASAKAPAATTNVLPNFPYYYQEDPYWCVPAAAKMTLKYITGQVYTQTFLASRDELGTVSGSGTTFSKVIEVLNRYQSSNSYVMRYKSNITQADMQNHFSDGINYYDAPAIYNATFTAGDGYPYSQSYKHALVVTGEYSDLSQFRVHDPVYNGAVPESYYVKSAKIWTGLVSYAY